MSFFEHGIGETSRLPIEWLPDETLFSLCSRFHYLAGHLSPSKTCRQLFGHSQQGSQHDLPSRLYHFAVVTGGFLGTAESIIRTRTLLSFYLPFHEARMVNNAISAMCGGGIGSLKFRLGLLTSRFRANHPLKACARCINEDIEAFNTSYWHLTHQLPGIWVCPTHQEPLLVAQQKHTGVGRFLWYLPNQTELIPAVPPAASDTIKARLVKIAEFALHVPAISPSTFAASQLAKCFRHQYMKIGFQARSNVRLGDAALAFSQFCEPLRIVSEFQALPASQREAHSQLSRQLQVARGSAHPLRTIVLGASIFESWEEFMTAYGHSSSSDAPLITNEGQPAPINPLVGAAIQLISEEGLSCRDAAARLGVATNSVMAWASNAGIHVQRRPKVLKPPIRESAIADLRTGHDKTAIATTYGISVETVTRLLATEPGLRDAWNEARFLATQGKYRNAWSQAISNNPSLGSKAVRMLEPAAYAWLYRNDLAWLTTQLDQMPKVRQGNNSKTDWDLRDRELATLVAKAALEIAEKNPQCRITLQMIYQRVHSLKPKLAQLDRLPLTRHAIEVATKKYPPNSKQLNLG
jgi:hypothetical protein